MGSMTLLRRLLCRMWRAMFKPAARYPADPRAVFILILSVFSGCLAIALRAAPDSLEALLPRWGVLVWGILLVIGSAVTIGGMLFQSLNGIICEQVGSVMVAATTIFYATLILWVVGPGGIQSAGIILAWGLSCILRWVQLQALIISTYKVVEEHRFIAAVEKALEEKRDRS